MKIKLIDRLLIALAGLLVFFIGVFVFVFFSGLFPFAKLDFSSLKGNLLLWQRAVIIGVAVVLLFLGLHGILLLFRKKQDKGFVFQQTEYGNMSISMKALEGMVKKCVEAQENVTLQSVRIAADKEKDGVNVDLKTLVRSGENIPKVINSMQRSVKQYVGHCSGVEVNNVSVMVETDLSKGALIPALMSPEEEELSAKASEEPAEKASDVQVEEAPAMEEPASAAEETPAEFNEETEPDTNEVVCEEAEE